MKYEKLESLGITKDGLAKRSSIIYRRAYHNSRGLKLANPVLEIVFIDNDGHSIAEQFPDIDDLISNLQDLKERWRL